MRRIAKKMLSPWINPRSTFYWFRRRIPARYRKFGMPAEIKFSLETTIWEEAVALCAEHNLRLEREWKAGLVGERPTPMSFRQIAGLAGEFYRETVSARSEEPGTPADVQAELSATKRRRLGAVPPPMSPEEIGRQCLGWAASLTKDFARSRAGWSSKIASGFAISKLVSDNFVVSDDRDDYALRHTLKAISAKLSWNSAIKHPVIDENIAEAGDEKTKFLKEKIDENLKHLDILDDVNCTHDQAMKAWDTFFFCDWFSKQPDPAKKSQVEKASGPAVIKQGETRYASRKVRRA